LRYTLLTRVGILDELEFMKHDILNSDHYCTSNMFEKLQNAHVVCGYGVVSNNDKIEMLK